jgi:hypothetical protein
MINLIERVAEFVTNPVNVLIFLFLWVGVALVGTAAPWGISLEILSLMGVPAMLGFLIGRKK